MSASLFSTSWYLVSELTPKLGSHTHIHRHCYRNTLWHVLEDRRSARQHRLSESAYFIVGRLDGERTVQQIWNLATEALGDQSPTQDEVIQLLGRLHAADVLLCDVPADTDELLRRQQDSTTKNLKRRLSNPLSMRFALCDPDRFLSRLLPLARPFISVWFACIWLVVVGSALALAITHWNTLSAEMLERVFAPYNLILMAICFPLLKGLHELGHAITTKAFGGEVHDTGICLLVLAPVPYVDASAASAFTSKRRRILVSMSGMAVELFVASLALFLWLNVQPGLVKDLAYVLMFIAGVSTVLFNANPLLKFDGYYVLSDAIEIPNLASRANRYITYLIQRYLFGVTDLDTPASAPGESTWFATYACAAFAYRVFILSVIIVFIAGKFFFLGVCLAIWAVIALICLPLAKAAKFVLASPQLTNQRSRAIGATSAILIAVTAFAFLMPLPFWTRVEGVVWLPEHSLVRSGIEGTVTRIVSVLDERVGVGQPLVITADPFLESHEKILQTNLAEAQARYRMAHSTSRVEAENLKLEIAHIRADLDQTRADLDKQTVRSSANGTFVLSRGDDLLGRHLKQGELIGYVGDRSDANVRVVISQTDIALVRQHTQNILVRFSTNPVRALQATIAREVPAADYRLPNKALGTEGGGKILVDPLDPSGTTALEKVFQIELTLAEPLESAHFGERVQVRFDHGTQPLASQLYRIGRQTLLRHFGV